MHLLDTDAAIWLREGDVATTARVAALPVLPAISILTQIELEGGVLAKPERAAVRRAATDVMLDEMTVLSFGPGELAAYRAIIEAVGYSRRKVIDRMIAATALVHGLTLITMNGKDFRDIPGLRLEVWPAIA